MPRSFDTVPQLLGIIKRSVGLAKFLFREVKSSGKLDIVLGKYEGIIAPQNI